MIAWCHHLRPFAPSRWEFGSTQYGDWAMPVFQLRPISVALPQGKEGGVKRPESLAVE